MADREGVDGPTAERHARAVFAVLGQAVSRRQLDDLAAQLSRDYSALLPTGPRVETLALGSFLKLVADRSSDIRVALPPLRWLTRRSGSCSATGSLEIRSFTEFVTRVAERTGHSIEQARDDVRAVVVTLREAVGDDEFFDVAVQLAREYDPVLAGAS